MKHTLSLLLGSALAASAAHAQTEAIAPPAKVVPADPTPPPGKVLDLTALKPLVANALGGQAGVALGETIGTVAIFSADDLSITKENRLRWGYRKGDAWTEAQVPQIRLALAVFFTKALGQSGVLDTADIARLAPSMEFEVIGNSTGPIVTGGGTANWGIQPWPGGISPADAGKPVLYTLPPAYQLGAGGGYPASYSPYPLAGTTMHVIPGLQYGYGAVQRHTYGFPAGYSQHLTYGQFPYPVYPSSQYFTPPFSGLEN